MRKTLPVVCSFGLCRLLICGKIHMDVSVCSMFCSFVKGFFKELVLERLLFVEYLDDFALF